MSIYPKKKTFGFDTEKLENMNTSGISGVGMAVGEAVSNIGKKDLGYGVSHKGVGANAVGTGIKGLGVGVEIGSKFGPMGTIIGAGIGWQAGIIGGALNGKELKQKALDEFTQKQGDAIGQVQRQSKKKYGTLQGFQGKTYAKGGKIKENESVILGGKLHKDGGNPIVKIDTKEKIAETEREELLLSYEHTVEIEDLIKKYDGEKSDLTLEKLGKAIKRILLKETKDNSGTYVKKT